jgi:5-methyltetrahydrofolate--homocysteine methyltransferase
MAMAAGLDAAILDPLDAPLMSALLAAEAVLGRDRHCGRYLRAYRQGKLT